MEAILQIAIITFIYWCVDEKKGLRLALILPVSAWINIALTSLLDRHAASAYDPAVEKSSMIIAAGHSAHVQNLLVMLMILASWKIIPRLPRAVHFVIAAVLCLLAGPSSGIPFGIFLSTDNFGIPSIMDIFGGWLIGAFVLLVYFLAVKFALDKRLEAWFEERGPRAGLVASAALAFAMNLYRPSEYMLIPGGLILGLGIGRFLCRRYMDFTAVLKDRTGTAKLLTLLVRYALGITAMALLYTVTGKAVNGLRDQSNYQLYIFTRYVLIAVLFSAGAPWVFCKLRLAQA